MNEGKLYSVWNHDILIKTLKDIQGVQMDRPVDER